MQFLFHQKIFEQYCQKCTFGHLRPAKIQISLHIHPVWSESSLFVLAQSTQMVTTGHIWIAKNASRKHAYVMLTP